MKTLLFCIAVIIIMTYAFIVVSAQTASVRQELNVNEIVGQLGLCNANLVVEQRFTKSLQAENLELRKRLSEIDGTPVKPKPDGSK